MNTDEIVYGNPTQSQVAYLRTSGYADKFFDQLIKFDFPKNSSRAAKEELNMIVDNIKALQDNADILKRYSLYDVNLYQFFAKTFRESSLDKDAMIIVDDLLNDINPLLYKLKFHFNRPRPHQLAKANNLSLFPYRSVSADSPSYPSGHTFVADIVCHVMGNYYPTLFPFFSDLAKDIELSRNYMGLNYPSDNDLSLFAANLIKEDREFKVKYHL